MYKRIVFPTDGSESSLQAAETAFKQAELFDAELHVVYIMQYDDGLVMTDPHMGVTINQQDIKQKGNQAVEKVREFGSGYDVEVTTEVRSGVSPHEGICEFAEEIDADLIIIGTHGWSGVRRVLLGSTTERVIRTTDLPVLTVQVSDE